LDLLVITITVIPECGLGMCPDDPANISGLGDVGGWLFIAGLTAISLVVGFGLDRRKARNSQ
jgi:hypothetical protein